jgi:5-deoxy-glucuronate isomerase
MVDTGRVSLLLRAGEWHRVTPESAGWRYLSFRVERVAGLHEDDTGGEETAIVLLEGACAVEAEGERFELGPRAGVFRQLPWTLYLPRDTSYRIEGEAQVAIASCPCEARLEPVLQRPNEVDVEIRGAGNATRQINNLIVAGFPAERLLVVEVLTPAGSWSSYPPHKHEQNRPPEEVALEEVYYYRAPAPEAFGLQRLYSPERGVDEAWSVRDGDLVQVPWGYHPFSAAPGYDFYYLNALAGDHHEMTAADDPELAWVRSTWAETPKDPRVPLVTA